MNKSILSLIVSLISLVLSLHCVVFAEDAAKPTETSTIFQERYNAWLAAREVWWHNHPYSSDRPQLSEDIALEEMGPAAIPFWISMFEEQLKNKTWDNMLLTESIDAFRSIVYKLFEVSDYPTGKYANQKITLHLYVEWWKEGRTKTPEKFDKLFNEWDGFDRVDDKKNAYKVARKIYNMGVEIVPIVMEKIEAGDTRLIPWIKGIMRTSVPWKSADLVTVKDWWEKNKEKLTFPEFQLEKPTPLVTPAK